MRTTIVTFPLCLLLAAFPVSPAAADGCDAEAAAKAGGWIQGDDAGGSGNPATAKHKAQIRPILDEMAALVRAAYPEPLGSQGKTYRNYGIEPFAGDLATYELVANFKGYGCDRTKNSAGEVRQHSETATWLYLQVNSFWSGNSRFESPQYFLSPGDHQNLYSIQPERVLRTPAPGYPDRKPINAAVPSSIAGYPNFVFEGSYDSWEKSYLTREVVTVVFLTPDGKMPYDPVTIGEFLDVNEERLSAYVRANEQYGDVEYHQGLLDRIPEIRRRHAARLEEPAYIRGATWSESDLAAAEPFADPASGYLLARRSARYAGAPGDAYRPRFLVVYWRYQPEVPYSLRVHEAIRDRLDFDKLRALLAG